MLLTLFIIMMLAVFGRLLVFAIRASWAIGRILVNLVFLPLTLILMVMGGLLHLAVPLLAIIGLRSLLVKE